MSPEERRRFPRFNLKRGETDYLNVELDERESFESAVLTLLIQEQRHAQLSLVVIEALGRLLLATLAIYLGLQLALSSVQFVSGALITITVAAVWWRGRERATHRVRAIEETLSRMTGGPAEHAYIETRFVLSLRSSLLDRVLTAEPLVWLAVVATILVVNAIVNGIAS